MVFITYIMFSLNAEGSLKYFVGKVSSNVYVEASGKVERALNDNLAPCSNPNGGG